MQSPSSFFELLFKKDITDAGNADYLKHIAEEHPYFSPAQFYLLQQKEAGTEAYSQQAIKTVVLFNNNYWLNFQLLKTQQPINLPAETVVFDEPIMPPVVEKNEAPENKISPEEETKPVAEEPTLVNEQPITIIREDKNIDQIEVPEEAERQPFEIKMPTLSLNNDSVTDGSLLFQPLYVTDYFASQGIKLSEDVQPEDKLGKQLKSFTEWLKTMKKINPDRIQFGHSAQTDSAIQSLAEKSNTDGDVLTETMAEVLMQQGKIEKAVEVYEKLSLLNPSKSAYFAAKIEQLKEH